MPLFRSPGHPEHLGGEELASFEGGVMSRTRALVKFLLLVGVLAALAMVLGGDPWGPV
jgi:hypothetical protein